MKRLFSFRLLVLLIFSAFLFSCASRKKMAYYQNIDSIIQTPSTKKFELTLQPDDRVRIIVIAENPEVAAPFNVSGIVSDKGIGATGQETNAYLIDAEGYILFPIIGKIKLGGLTKTQAETELNSVLREYIKGPSVGVTLLNFKITVQGEVGKPGLVMMESERLTLPEALSMAGDLTIFGKRENIMIVRENDGKKTVARVDITKADFINSPYYYLAQNDLVYVEPNKTKMNTSKVDPSIGLIFSSISLLITIIVFITR